MRNSLRILWTHLGWLALTFLSGPALAYGPGCPHPAAEPAVLPAATALLNASMKWCGIAEAPGIANPALVCEPSFRDYMWRRHERASDRIWIPQCRITLRSGAAGISHLNYKMFGDLDTTTGLPGDIVVSPITEMDNTWLQCDMAWNTPTPQPKGVIAVSARLNPPILWTPLFAFTGDGTSLTVNVPWDPAGNRFFQVSAHALPTVNLACGDNRRIYRNLTDKEITITIQATDQCESFRSELTIRNERDEAVETARIDDGATETVTVTVPKKGSVYVDCSGSEGRCQYTISP
ncbi:MAG TPA: hypothetical protein VNO52_10480 [Methylomirabilota bacterium]|nr:hypothetical protein [Methylomirabilota bacterium]